MISAEALTPPLGESTGPVLQEVKETILLNESGGVLNIGGFVTLSSWGGASVRTENNYVATKDLNLSFSVDRVSVDIDIGARTGVFIANADRSEFVFFSQNSGDVAENTAVWQVNVNSTGNGMNIPAFDFANGSLGRHTMEMIANGETVELLLDGVSGGKFPFEVASGIHFEIGAYSELAEAFDQVNAVFDDVQIANVLPSIEISPSSVTALINSHDNVATVTIPALLNDGQDVSVTVTSSDPGVVVPGGEAGGSLTLLFEAGAPNVQDLVLVPTGKGSATLDLSTDSEAGVKSMRVNVVSEPEEALIENFGGSSLDANRWDIDNLPFDSGVATADSSVSVVDGQLVIDVTAEESLWPGFAVFTKERFNASLENPITFEVNRTNLDFVLTTGTGSEQRTGAYVRDDNGNFVFFNDYVAHDGRNFGWRYNKQTGAPDDDPTGAGVNISAFDGGLFDNRGDHRLKMIVNGATVQLYLDDIFGAEVEFASANGLSFGIGAYVDETGNVTVGSFDNVLVLAGDSGAGPVDFVPSSGVALEWSESVLGPWIEAGTESPFAVPADSDAAFFRLNGSTEPLSISIDGGNVTVEW